MSNLSGLRLTVDDLLVETLMVKYEGQDKRLLVNMNSNQYNADFNIITLSINNLAGASYGVYALVGFYLLCSLFDTYLWMLVLPFVLFVNYKRIYMCTSYYHLVLSPLWFISLYWFIAIFLVSITVYCMMLSRKFPSGWVVHYSPHLVTYLYTQYCNGVSEDVYRDTNKLRLKVLSSFPLPTERVMDLYEGSTEIALFILKSCHFFMKDPGSVALMRLGSPEEHCNIFVSAILSYTPSFLDQLWTFITQIEKYTCCLRASVKSICRMCSLICYKALFPGRSIQLTEDPHIV